MSDQEMYKKMQFMRNDDEMLGCYIEGHYDDEQFKIVAIEFVNKELNWGKDEPYCIEKGYYKFVPGRYEGGWLHFSETPMRGSKPIMHMYYQ